VWRIFFPLHSFSYMWIFFPFKYLRILNSPIPTMQSSSQAPKPRRFDASRRTANSAGSKLRGSSFQREDKNMNTITATSPRRSAKPPAASSRIRPGAPPRAPVIQSRLSSQKQGPARSAKPKLKSGRPSVVNQIAPEVAAPPLPLPSVLPLDPNCNEPSLPCLCCDGRSPQDNNSMFNHNHNNNNTISIRQQLQLPPPPPPVAQLAHKHEGMESKEHVPSYAEPPAQSAAHLENDAKNGGENADVDNKKKVDEEDEEEESSRDIAIDNEEDDDETDSDDDDDDTLVPSCCDCPPSLLEFSLSSSTSSSSTSISSCSDLESDCADHCTSMCSSQDQDHLSAALDPKDRPLKQFPEFKPPSSLPLNQNPFSLTSHSTVASCSPDEGYPSALDSPSPDYLGVKGDSDTNKLDLLDFLESMGEFGKMERFSQVIQVARLDLEGEQHWDVLRDHLDHLDRLEKVNREVKLAYIARLHEKGFDLGDLEEQDLSDVMDEMGNIDIPWKLYKTRDGTMAESQEFSDAGVDLTAPSDCDDPLVPDSLTPSPIKPPPRPPKPPARHASVSSDLHTYINISRETTSMAVTTSPTLSTFSPNSSSPTFSTFRCEKPLPPSPPSIPPLPAFKPVPYLTLYTTPSPPPSIPTPTPPIPPPRKRHLARKEAQRLAALQAEQEKTPFSLPPPTTRPPPLPPPPVISVTCSFSPPAIPPPPALPPPPSFHALDVEIRKLLMLAGLTQAELLKLSPELGVCVGELDIEEEADNNFTSRSLETREFGLQDGEGEKENDTCKVDGDGKASEKGNKEGESKDTQQTTSFTEIARKRKKNSALVTDHYYSTHFINPHEATVKNFSYPNELPDSPPPPPPPRPLPPIPPSLAPLKVSTLPANSEQPERFDWLIAFTPECETPPQLPVQEKSKSTTEIPKKPSSSGSGPKVTTFKELRFRNKNTSAPTKVITEPEPDPTIITPDPDILYNLRWRREKAGSDGSQWEYTSQAQALFMQPPPALTSMAALKEMLQRADKEGGQLELCPSQKIGCSVSDFSLWNVGQDKEIGELKQEMKDRKIEEGKEEVEVRGQADGSRTFESRTSACIHRDDSSCLVGSGFNDSLADFRADSPHYYRDIFSENTHSAYKYVSDSKTKTGDFDSKCNFDSLYSSDLEMRSDTHASLSGTSGAQGCTTPYKNIDVMMTYSDSISAVDSLCSEKRSHADDSSIKARMSKELPPLPTCFLYHPKNCPLHRGAPPRLSPIGALSPPQRSGAPPLSRLNSPLFPRSHTLPALAAPLYYPNLYPPIPPRAPPLPPKLYQGPSQPHATNGEQLVLSQRVYSPSPHTIIWRQMLTGLRCPDLPIRRLGFSSYHRQGWGAVVRWGGRLSQNLADFSLSGIKKEETKTNGPDLQDQAGSNYSLVSGTQVPWSLGRLFGASKSPNSPTGHAPPTRSIRTLCDHTGTGSELSFCKGEELVVLGGVDQDWIRCRQGDKEGLVPIGYTSLIM
ncbi:hypothetical protein GOODEAATRI_001287, partial [Goodea atripinnis]